MATRTSDSSAAASQLRTAQNTLTRLLVRDIRGLRRLIRPDRLQESVPLWMAAVRALVDQYGAASAVVAAGSYDRQRTAAGAAGRFDAEPASGSPEGQVEASLRWATRGLWETEADQEPFDVRLAQAERLAEGVAQKLVADQGRATTRQAVDRDREAVAYARAAALGGCAFCKLMASRGAVYKNARTAGRDANEKFTGDGSVVKFHDNCHCVVIPVFRGQQFALSAHAAEWDRIYREFAAPYPGDQLRRFRLALADNGHLPAL